MPNSTAFVFLSAGLGATPLPVPNVIGLVGLDSTFQFTGLLVTLNAHGLGAGTLATPPASSPFCGTTWYTQSVVVEAGTNNLVLTNTARVRI